MYLINDKSFASYFVIETADSNLKSLKRRKRPLKVQVEHILPDPPELKENVLLLGWLLNELKILHWWFIYSSIKVQDKSLNYVVPLWLSIYVFDHVVDVAVFVVVQYSILGVLRSKLRTLIGL